MESMLVDAGYPALFLVSFLAASLLPLGSEWLVALHVAAGGTTSTIVAVATAGNLLGAMTTYWIGLKGGDWLVRTALRISHAQQDRAAGIFRRYGAWSLLFSWLPVVGDPLCLVGGILRVPFAQFSMLVAIGKCGRYATVAWLAIEGKKTFFSSPLFHYLQLT